MQVKPKSTDSFGRKSADKAHFYNLNNVVTLKIRSRSRKSNHFFNYPNDITIEVWPESII